MKRSSRSVRETISRPPLRPPTPTRGRRAFCTLQRFCAGSIYKTPQREPRESKATPRNKRNRPREGIRNPSSHREGSHRMGKDSHRGEMPRATSKRHQEQARTPRRYGDNKHRDHRNGPIYGPRRTTHATPTQRNYRQNRAPHHSRLNTRMTQRLQGGRKILEPRRKKPRI